MEEKLTSFKMTTSCKKFQDALIKESGIKKNVFQKRAIDYFISTGGDIKDELKVTNYKDEKYICKQAKEQVYLDDNRRSSLELIAHNNEVGITTVLFQAMLNYCMYYYKNEASIDKERLKEIIEN